MLCVCCHCGQYVRFIPHFTCLKFIIWLQLIVGNFQVGRNKNTKKARKDSKNWPKTSRLNKQSEQWTKYAIERESPNCSWCGDSCKLNENCVFSFPFSFVFSANLNATTNWVKNRTRFSRSTATKSNWWKETNEKVDCASGKQMLGWKKSSKKRGEKKNARRNRVRREKIVVSVRFFQFDSAFWDSPVVSRTRSQCFGCILNASLIALRRRFFSSFCFVTNVLKSETQTQTQAIEGEWAKIQRRRENGLHF